MYAAYYMVLIFFAIDKRVTRGTLCGLLQCGNSGFQLGLTLVQLLRQLGILLGKNLHKY